MFTYKNKILVKDYELLSVIRLILLLFFLIATTTDFLTAK